MLRLANTSRMWKNGIAVFALLAQISWAETPNLIQNGNFESVPPASQIPGMEEHANASYWKQPKISDWQLGGTTTFIFVKQPSMRGLDVSKGTASQTIPTIPGNTYRITLTCFMNTEFRRDCTLTITCDGKTSRFPVAPQANVATEFVARSNATAITFGGQGEAGGPRISRVRCVGFDAATRRILNQLEPVYRELDRAEKSEKDLTGLNSRLAEDFSWQPLEGPGRDRSGYEDLVRQRFEKKFKVYTEPVDASVQADGSYQVEVVRRESYSGDYGKLETSSLRFQHVWVKSGNAWMLKSARQLEP